MTGASESEARAFAAAFRSFLDWIHPDEDEEEEGSRNEVVAMVVDFLGEDGATQSVVTRQLPPFEHVNLQTALEAWMIESGRSVVVQGITNPPHYGSITLQQLVTGTRIPPLRLSAPSLVDLPNGPGSTLACLVLAALLVSDARGSYVVMVVGPTEQEPRLAVEVAGLSVTEAQAVHAELDELRSRLNVYRGHVLDVSIGGCVEE